MHNTTRHHEAEVLARLTIDISDPKELSEKIAAYLLHEKKTAELDSLLRDIMQYRADHVLLEAKLTTTDKATDLIISEVKQILRESYPSAKQVVVTEEQDLNIVGGVKIEMANERLDMSVRAKLDKFKRLIASAKE